MAAISFNFLFSVCVSMNVFIFVFFESLFFKWKTVDFGQKVLRVKHVTLLVQSNLSYLSFKLNL